MTWSELSEWWVSEVAGDPAYDEVVSPLLLEVLQPRRDHLYLDLGSGEGRLMRTVSALGARVHGVDISFDLATRSADRGPTIVGSLPGLQFIRTDSYDGAFCVLVVEHVADHESLFEEVGRVVRPGGTLALVMNHPVWTAPDSTPIHDSNGELLWRPGAYFSSGTSEEPAGERTVRFHHRTISALLNAAANAAWTLEIMIEKPHHELVDQPGIPRLLACRWRLLP